MNTVRAVVWDWSIRIFHWGLVIGCIGSYITGDTVIFPLHLKFGFFILGLLFFRMLIGFFGSQESRFNSFVQSPTAVCRYIIGKNKYHGIGHNPLGGYSTIGFLFILFSLVATGLLSSSSANDAYGPLSFFIDSDISEIMLSIHNLLFKIFLGFVVVHLLAVFYFYVIKKINLIGSMIHGKKIIPSSKKPIITPGWLLFIFLLIALGLAIAIHQYTIELCCGGEY